MNSCWELGGNLARFWCAPEHSYAFRCAPKPAKLLPLSVSPTGFEPVGPGDRKPRQDALLPPISLISLGFVIPPRPMLFPGVPPQSTLEGHTGGTWKHGVSSC